MELLYANAGLAEMILQMQAELLGANPDLNTLTLNCLQLTYELESNCPTDEILTHGSLTNRKIENALRRNGAARRQFKALSIKLGKYVKWALPFLYRSSKRVKPQRSAAKFTPVYKQAAALLITLKLKPKPDDPETDLNKLLLNDYHEKAQRQG